MIGALAGGAAAVLGVLALPSIPTRRATVVLLGLGGLAALAPRLVRGCRSQLAARDLGRGDDAHARSRRPRRRGNGSRARGRLAAAEPAGGDRARRRDHRARRDHRRGRVRPDRHRSRLGRHVWPGLEPNVGDRAAAPSSLHVERPTRPDDPAPALRRGRVHRRRFPRPTSGGARPSTSTTRPGAAVTTDRAGRTANPTTPSTSCRTRRHDASQIAPDLYDVGARRSGTSSARRSMSRRRYSDVVFAAPSPRVVETDRLLHEQPDGTVRVGVGEPGFRRASARARSTPSRAAASR